MASSPEARSDGEHEDPDTEYNPGLLRFAQQNRRVELLRRDLVSGNANDMRPHVEQHKKLSGRKSRRLKTTPLTLDGDSSGMAHKKTFNPSAATTLVDHLLAQQPSKLKPVEAARAAQALCAAASTLLGTQIADLEALAREKLMCVESGCSELALRSKGSDGRCHRHGSGERCEFVGCFRLPKKPGTRCITHGGGKRCEVERCPKSAQGKTARCIACGGGKRCEEPSGCDKGALGSTRRCRAHGGGRRCEAPGCSKSAEACSKRCAQHGGGRRCVETGCGNAARDPFTMRCKDHGGGKRCEVYDCSKLAAHEGKLRRCKVRKHASQSHAQSFPLTEEEG